ncbi:aromatic acid exporter family protein, partial [Bacillus pumilus]|uniref:aromatic acid exporter family protein n=1 Tax=Bacillus pumilus TaxID=1408 RepID=UPI00370419B9
MGRWVGLGRGVLGGIGGVFGMEGCIYGCFLRIVDEVEGNIIGGGVGIRLGVVFGSGGVIMGLTGVMVIGINLKVKIEDT